MLSYLVDVFMSSYLINFPPPSSLSLTWSTVPDDVDCVLLGLFKKQDIFIISFPLLLFVALPPCEFYPPILFTTSWCCTTFLTPKCHYSPVFLLTFILGKIDDNFLRYLAGNFEMMFPNRRDRIRKVRFGNRKLYALSVRDS